ncbi:MAG TPA: helix-turn-helix domain-containing protein [Solirubrobacteraceae bacterium]|nr:helix-turn-helix domain-containing protein [Solirubrobacteraceae bacterium]
MLETARILFAERGFAAVTMDQIAAEAGVTKPLLYNRFGNKEAVYLASMEPAAEALVDTVAAAVAATETPGDALRAGVHAFFIFVDADRSAWRVLFDETLPAGAEPARRAAEQRERLTELVAAAELERVPAERREAVRVEIEALAAAMLGAAEALARWWLRTDAMPAADAAELLVRTLERGLVPR